MLFSCFSSLVIMNFIFNFKWKLNDVRAPDTGEAGIEDAEIIMDSSWPKPRMIWQGLRLWIYWHFVHAAWVVLPDGLQTDLDVAAVHGWWERCNYWMTDVRVASPYNSHLCHLTSESCCSYRGGTKRSWCWVAFRFWAGQEKDMDVTWNQKSDIKEAIKIIQPSICPLWCVAAVLSAGLSAWLLPFYYLPLCEPFGRVLSVWK